MNSLLCVKVKEEDYIVLFPVNRIDCILRTDHPDRADCVKILGEDGIYECANDTFGCSLVEYAIGGKMV